MGFIDTTTTRTIDDDVVYDCLHIPHTCYWSRGSREDEEDEGESKRQLRARKSINKGGYSKKYAIRIQLLPLWGMAFIVHLQTTDNQRQGFADLPAHPQPMCSNPVFVSILFWTTRIGSPLYTLIQSLFVLLVCAPSLF